MQTVSDIIRHYSGERGINMNWIATEDVKQIEHGAEYLAMLDGGDITLVIYDSFDDCFNDSYDASPYQRQEITHLCKIELPEEYQYQN